METLFKDIPLDKMNTSMTINAPAAWLLSLYIAAAERQGASRDQLSGTTQNDIIKEYLSRGTHIFPPGPSMRLTRDVVTFCYKEIPKWNPMNVCSYHLQEAGATPVQELSYALATAIAVLDSVKESGVVSDEDFGQMVGRISFFVNAGIKFVTELCKMRAFTELWDEITKERYGVEEEKYRRFRYGVQVNSLGLTEQQPENNVYRVLLEMLAVVLSKNARARAVQLPAWNEALGLPRPWDQQWSLRLQQIVAYETDLQEYGDLFDGSEAITEKVEALKAEARAELKTIEEMGGAIEAVESGYLKRNLVASHADRIATIESGEMTVVGVNKFQGGEESPLTSGDDSILVVDPAAEAAQIEKLKAWRAARDNDAAEAALSAFKAAVESGENVMESSIKCAHAGITTGEWAEALRDVFGEYRAPTGLSAASSGSSDKLDAVRARVGAVAKKVGRPLKMLVGKPGLDGHSNGAEQVAVRARDVGFEVVYQGIRLTPEQIANAAMEEAVDVVGLSILSGSHMPLVTEVVERMAAAGVGDIPVVVGGIIPPEDAAELRKKGVAGIYTPRDYDITAIMAEVAGIVESRSG